VECKDRSVWKGFIYFCFRFFLNGCQVFCVGRKKKEKRRKGKRRKGKKGRERKKNGMMQRPCDYENVAGNFGFEDGWDQKEEGKVGWCGVVCVVVVVGIVMWLLWMLCRGNKDGMRVETRGLGADAPLGVVLDKLNGEVRKGGMSDSARAEMEKVLSDVKGWRGVELKDGSRAYVHDKDKDGREYWKIWFDGSRWNLKDPVWPVGSSSGYGYGYESGCEWCVPGAVGYPACLEYCGDGYGYGSYPTNYYNYYNYGYPSYGSYYRNYPYRYYDNNHDHDHDHNSGHNYEHNYNYGGRSGGWQRGSGSWGSGSGHGSGSWGSGRGGGFGGSGGGSGRGGGGGHGGGGGRGGGGGGGGHGGR
jgi:hypothetical protein